MSSSSVAYKPRKQVRVQGDFGLARMAVLAQEAWGRGLTTEERATFLAQRITRGTQLPNFDVLNVNAILQADIDSRMTYGRIYRLLRGEEVLPYVYLDLYTARCPKCDSRTDVGNMVPCVAYNLRLPNFSGCECRSDEGVADDTCRLCDGKGFTITSWTEAVAYMMCGECIARERQPTRRGSATNFTTTSRAGEEHARRPQKNRAMCTQCQQRYASRKASKQGPATCVPCAEEGLRQRMKRNDVELAELRGQIAQLMGGK